MPLTLIATNNKQAALLNGKLSFTFGPDGGSFGRSENNDWVLPDPQRYVSSNHAVIEKDANGYMLTDVSTNGTYVNSSRRALGKDNKSRLQDGDILRCGEYELQVKLAADNEDMPKAADTAAFDSMFDESAQRMQQESNALDEMLLSPAERSLDSLAMDDSHSSLVIPADAELLTPGYTGPEDPMAHLDGHGQPADNLSGMGLEPNRAAKPSAKDESAQMNSLYTPPAISEPAAPQPVAPAAQHQAVLPEQWDQQSSPAQPQIPSQPVLNQPAPAAQTAPQITPQIPPQATQQAAPTAHAHSTGSHSAADGLTIVFTAMGLPAPKVNETVAANMLKELGHMTRATVEGTVGVLKSREAMQKDFGTAPDRLRPVEDNPLRIADSVDDALLKLFNTSRRNYLKPTEAIKEALEDLTDHQSAMLAGVKAAYSAVMPVFEPEGLIKRFERYGYNDQEDGEVAAWYWEMFEHYYDELSQEGATGLGRLFSDIFKHAYDQQIRLGNQQRRNPNMSPGAAAAAEIIGDFLQDD